jgi:predicted enzyme related to lactoylglutathione lyase
MFGMKELNRCISPNVYDESIMGFADGPHLAIFAPLAEAPIKKSKYPVALIFTPDLDGVIARMEAAKYSVMRLPEGTLGAFKIAVAYDPSGNAIEMFSRSGKWEVGGSKLIVDDLQKAEAFFTKIFNATPGKRFATPAYDEVIMTLGAGPFLALFHPLDEAPLPKSQFPVIAIYTMEFDAVLNRVKEMGLGYRDLKTSAVAARVIIAKDAAGNAIEIISGRPAPHKG